MVKIPPIIGSGIQSRHAEIFGDSPKVTRLSPGFSDLLAGFRMLLKLTESAENKSCSIHNSW